MSFAPTFRRAADPLRRLWFALPLTVAMVSPAAASGPYSLDREIKEVRGWTIAVNKARQGCLAFASFKSGTAVEIGFDTKKDSAFLVFANEDWSFIQHGDKYDVRMIFNGNKRWNARAIGVEIGDLRALAFEGVKTDFVVDFAAYSSVRLEVEGERLDGFSLSGTMAALDAMIDCSQYVSGQ